MWQIPRILLDATLWLSPKWKAQPRFFRSVARNNVLHSLLAILIVWKISKTKMTCDRKLEVYRNYNKICNQALIDLLAISIGYFLCENIQNVLEYSWDMGNSAILEIISRDQIAQFLSNFYHYRQTSFEFVFYNMIVICFIPHSNSNFVCVYR